MTPASDYVLWIRWCLFALAVLSAGIVFDRIMLAMEQRGWIYYRKKRASPGSLGNAFLHVHSMLEPDKRHIVETRLDERLEQEDEGGSDGPNRSHGKSTEH